MEGARDSTSSSRRNIVCKIFDVETVRVALRPSQVVGRRPRLDGEAAIELRHAPPRRRVDGRSSPGMWRERVGWHRRQEIVGRSRCVLNDF